MAQARALVVFACLLAAGCSSAPDAPIFEDAAPEVRAVGEEVSSIVRGFLVLGPEVRSIKPCGEERELWVVPVTDVADAYDALRGESYGPVFMELEGVVGPAPAEGRGSDYGGQLRVTGFRRAAPAAESAGCREDPSTFAFRALGAEPFWGLRIRGASIVYSTPDIPETIFEDAAPAFAGGAWVYTSVSAGPEPIDLMARFVPERCTDAMVGAIYTWSATVEIGGEMRSGCAWEGALAPGR